MEEKRVKYPVSPTEYKILEEIGQGVSGLVFRALCIPLNEYVAIKQLDLEKCNGTLQNITREAQTMTLINHPNVVRAHCSFMVDTQLWVVMPYLGGGSCFHIMKATSPDGFEEPVIATILRETLKALEYLHRQGHIHRDVKAGNILIDETGGVKLGDFGVTACMFETGDRQRRTTFTGTPCWMAPEILEQREGYDFKADIWSFGITALELAHGHAPFSKHPPMKVLLMTLQCNPPGLNSPSDKKFSKSFREMISMCLVKDPTKRPPAEKLLKHVFFKGAKSSSYLVRTILDGLPPLWERVKEVKRKDEARLAQQKMPFGEQEERSQNEYKRAVSSWVDVDYLKAQAALIPDDPAEEGGKGSETASRVASPHPPEENHQKPESVKENECAKQMNGAKVKGRFNVYTDDRDVDASNWNETPEQHEASSSRVFDEREAEEVRVPEIHNGAPAENGAANGALKPPTSGCKDYDKKCPLVQKKGRFSVTSADVELKDRKDGVVHVPGVKVFGSNNAMDQTDGTSPSSLRRTTSLQPSTPSTAPASPALVPVNVLSFIQNLMNQNAALQETLANLFAIVSGSDSSNGASNPRLSRSVSANGVDGTVEIASAFDRERFLAQKIAELEAKEKSLQEELQTMKLRNIQIERQLNAHYNREEEERIRREEADA